MSTALHEYHADLDAVENQWHSGRASQPWVIGSSPWDQHLALLREIDQRHGVAPQDPRIYSIAAYQTEREQIEAEWQRLRQTNGWSSLDAKESNAEAFFEADVRHQQRLSDCRARHFPGLDDLRTETIDTIPKLWAHITGFLLVVRRFWGNKAAKEQHSLDQDVQTVYSLLHTLRVPWAPEPPYKRLTGQEAMDELQRVANCLEREDAQRGEGLQCPQCTGPLPVRDIGRCCQVCRSLDGKLAGLWVAVNTAKPDHIAEWPAIQHYACELFGHSSFVPQTMERLKAWLQTVHARKGEALWGIPLRDVCDLLTHAVSRKGERGSNFQVEPSAATASPEAEAIGPNDREGLILETMLDMGVVSSEERRTHREIVAGINSKHFAENYKHAFASLGKQGYLLSRKGTDGGVWLTKKGIAAAERQRQPRISAH